MSTLPTIIVYDSSKRPEEQSGVTIYSPDKTKLSPSSTPNKRRQKLRKSRKNIVSKDISPARKTSRIRIISEISVAASEAGASRRPTFRKYVPKRIREQAQRTVKEPMSSEPSKSIVELPTFSRASKDKPIEKTRDYYSRRDEELKLLERLSEERMREREEKIARTLNVAQKVIVAFRHNVHRSKDNSIPIPKISKRGNKEEEEDESLVSSINLEKDFKKSSETSEITNLEEKEAQINEELIKLGLIQESFEEHPCSNGLTSSKTGRKEKKPADYYYRVEPNREILHRKLEAVAKEKAEMEKLLEEEEEREEEEEAFTDRMSDRLKWKPTGDVIKESDMEFCQSHTKFSAEEITHWFKAFRSECPNGRLTKTHLHSLFCRIFPAEDSEGFCNHIFRIFDSDGNQFLDFKEFLMALDVASCQNEKEKLEWAFRLYDVDSSGGINLKEIKAVMETFSALESGEQDDEYEKLKFLKHKTIDERAEYIFDILDVDDDGEVTLEEFVDGYLRIVKNMV